MGQKILTTGSLFAGGGGLELGLEMTGGFRTIWSVEIEERCNEIRERHWPDVPQYTDVRTFPPVQGVETPDVLCGGSPCQDLSCAGKRAGLAGERSGLFLQMVRIIRALRPRYVVWENVRGVLSSNGGHDFRAVIGHFSDFGYTTEWALLRASDFGHRHGRARIFVVAYRPEFRRDGDRTFAGDSCKGEEEGRLSQSSGRGSELEHAEGERCEAWRSEHAGLEGGSAVAKSGDAVANAGGGQFSEPGRGPEARDGAGPAGSEHELADSQREGLEERPSIAEDARQEQSPLERSGAPYRCAPGPGLTFDSVKCILKLYASDPGRARAMFEACRADSERWPEVLTERPWLAPAVKSGFRGVVDGVSVVVDASRAARLKALGNAVVPDCARWIGEKILERERVET